ncbi:hypothetical protein FOL47_008642 [Perkinsus chesapeaki]|uniref:Uncharacterized protein n=1 Tax=Perkinsus chesapeaki TaxID=330153 RepID=A0A7J6LD22_PERCH|nr:hypothetical protein FOL47_008642 [Perkinsus chesapeaki]
MSYGVSMEVALDLRMSNIDCNLVESLITGYFTPVRNRAKEVVHRLMDEAVAVCHNGKEVDDPPHSSVQALLDDDGILGTCFFKRIEPSKNGDLRAVCRWSSRDAGQTDGLRTVTSNRKLYRFGEYECLPRYFPGGQFIGANYLWRLSVIRRGKDIFLIGLRVAN